MDKKEVEILLIVNTESELSIQILKKNNNNLDDLYCIKNDSDAIDFIYGTGAFEGRTSMIRPKLILFNMKNTTQNGSTVLKKLKLDAKTKIPIIVIDFNSN